MKYTFSKLVKKVFDSPLDNKGFTLIEIVIAVVMFTILSTVMVAVFVPFNRNNTDQQVITDVVQKLRSALAYMEAEIKLAGLDPEESNNFEVETADSTVFTYDYDTPDPANDNIFDGVLNASATRPERKTFRFLNGRLEEVTNLGLIDPAPVETLIPSVDAANSSFVYLDEDRNIIPTPVSVTRLGDIRMIRIVLSAEQPSGRSGNIARTMDTLVLCRNLYFNSQR